MFSGSTDSNSDTRRKDWKLLSAMNLFFMFGFTIYMGVFQNFFAEIVRGDELNLGLLESLREIPGLLAALMAGTLVAITESRISVLGLSITGIGIAATGFFADFWGVVAVTVFWSIGFHLWSTVQPSMILKWTKGVESARFMGQMRSSGMIATIFGLALAYGLSKLPHPPSYLTYYLLSGGSICIGSLLGFFLSRDVSHAERERIILRKEYGLYYFLIFLEGCRRQIFSIFALFTLIKVYHTDLAVVLGLFLINAILSSIFAPRMGKFIDRVGERIPLTIYASGIILIFLGYALVPVAAWLYVLYVVDNILFSFSIGLSTYLHRIVRPGELTPCLAMGTTMNHIAAVGLPVAGAWLWKASGDYRQPFFVGVALAVVALIATQKLPNRAPDVSPEAA